jgi:hypothetical protein
MDNYEHRTFFGWGRFIRSCRGQSMPQTIFPPQYVKWGWYAAMTLRQYLEYRECRKVAQHCCRLMTIRKLLHGSDCWTGEITNEMNGNERRVSSDRSQDTE